MKTPNTFLFSFFILILNFTDSSALFIKGSTPIKDITTGKVFAELYDSTYVTQGIITRKSQPYIETKAELAETEVDQDFLSCHHNQTNQCSYKLLDTTALINHVGDTIGKIWNPFGIKRKFPIITDLREHGQGFQVYIKGVISADNIYSFTPWNEVLEGVEPDSLFSETYYSLSYQLRKIKTEFKDEFLGEFKSASTYDKSLPAPRLANQYFFNSDTLKALWTEAEIDSLQRTKFKKKWLYYDKSIHSQVNSVKEMICESFSKRNGDILQFNVNLDKCR
ncbi:MAG: hypothetical protein OCC49_11975 [Fibrobacterales bacterium]